MSKAIGDMDSSLDDYKFYEAADKIYHFVWHEFCDWYIELAKPSLEKGNQTSLAVLVDTLDQILKLLHPFMPYVTEEIWQHFPSSGKSLSLAPFPVADSCLIDKNSEATMKILQDAIVEVRTLKAENGIPLKKTINLLVKCSGREAGIVREYQIFFKTLANVQNLEILEEFPKEQKLLKGVSGLIEIAIPLEEGLVGLEKEKLRLEREITRIKIEIEKIEKRMGNKGFLDRAPRHIIEETKERLKELQSRKRKLNENLEHILLLI